MDKIYAVISNNIFDGVNDGTFAGAVVIKDKLISEVLFKDAFKSRKDLSKIEVIDLGDLLLMPAFIDAHTHFFLGAVNESRFVCLDIANGSSKEECAKIIADFANANPDLKRIRGCGWFVGNWEDDSFPTKALLDELIPDRPVYLQNADQHSYWLNSAALKEANISPDPEMKDGIIETDENGELTGMLFEPAATKPASEKYMDFEDEELKEILISFGEKLKDYGICAVSEMFADDYTDETYHMYDLARELDLEGKLPVNVFAYTKMFGETDFKPFFKMKEHFNSEHFKINGVKGFIDGVTESYTGLMLEPYADRPWSRGENLPLWPKEKMTSEIIKANSLGIQVRLHCIADGSVRMALDMYEKSNAVNGQMVFSNTIEHAENIHPDDIKRFAPIGVIASMQPEHVILSNNDKIIRLGKERVRYEWPIKSLLDSGAAVSFGTDHPVVDANPLISIQSAVTRCDKDGNEMSSNIKTECISVFEALKAYTSGASRAYQMENKLGRIEAGFMANMIAIDNNLFEIPSDKIRYSKVKMNIFEGKIIKNE